MFEHDHEVQKGDVLLQTLCIHILTESPLVHDRPVTVRQYNAITCRSPSPPALDWAAAGAGPRSTLDRSPSAVVLSPPAAPSAEALLLVSPPPPLLFLLLLLSRFNNWRMESCTTPALLLFLPAPHPPPLSKLIVAYFRPKVDC